MQELYKHALRCYQNNDYEGALKLLRQCEMSAQVNALQSECANALRAQYKYFIDEAIKSGDTSSIHEYASKYQTYIGTDSYISSVIKSSSSKHITYNQDSNDDAEPWYNQEVAGVSLKIILIIVVGLAVVVGGIMYSNGNHNKVEQAPAEDTAVVDYTEDISDVPQQDDDIMNTDPDIILTARLSDGNIHEFYQVYADYKYTLHTRIKGENKSEVIGFSYTRYQDNEPFYTDGFPAHIRYIVSKDKRFIYVVAAIQACGSGWTTEYQIFKVDVETKKSKILVECAAIEAVSDGFIVAKARCTNEDTAKGGYDLIWVLHDEKIDFDGNTVYVSEKEYDPDVMTKRFSSDTETDLKGFKSCTKSNEY